MARTRDTSGAAATVAAWQLAERAGLATPAALAGAAERDIMRRPRHTSVAVARRYIRDGSLFHTSAAAVGL